MIFHTGIKIAVVTILAIGGGLFLLYLNGTAGTSHQQSVTMDELKQPASSSSATAAREEELPLRSGTDSDVAVSPALQSQPTVASPTPASLETIMAWSYPGPPACTGLEEAALYQLDVIKPEYFVVRTDGELELMTEEKYGCNGYSSSTTALVRTLAPEQFVMVSAAYAPEMAAFLAADAATGEHVERLVDFVVAEEFTGVEIDFEDFGGWTPTIYAEYKAFIQRLGTALHREGKQLMIDLPATRDEIEEAWYQVRLTDFVNLPVDYLVIMAYDYQFDHGIGQPVAPLDWITDVVSFTKSRYPYHDRLVIGVPSYGYKFEAGRISILTAAQITAEPGYHTAERDQTSQELLWQTNGVYYAFQDEKSMQAKIDVILRQGIGKVSIWHLGGNPWFR
jgi:spore germination protein YaaH